MPRLRIPEGLAPEHSYPSPGRQAARAPSTSTLGRRMATLAALRRPDLFGAFMHYNGSTG